MPVHFSLNGSETCDGITNASGRARCTLTPGEAACTYTLTASFAGSPGELASSTSSAFVVNHEEMSLVLVHVLSFIVNGSRLTLAATLTDPPSGSDGEFSATPITLKTITFNLGSGGTAQTCSAVTNVHGTAWCVIARVSQPLGPRLVGASFAGDGYDHSASATGHPVVFGYLPHGSFVIGNLSAVTNATVTWWGPKWANANHLSGGTASSSFEGYAASISCSPPAPACTWSSTGSQSASPPSSVPSYMAVIVTSKVNKSGSTYSGTITRIAIIMVLPSTCPAITPRPLGPAPASSSAS